MITKYIVSILLCSITSLNWTADETPIQLMDCFTSQPVSVPGPQNSHLWFIKHKLLDLQTIDEEAKSNIANLINPTTKKLLRCCIGSVEGSDSNLVAIMKQIIVSDLNNEVNPWHHPSDSRSILNLELFVNDNSIDIESDEFKSMQADLVWFHACDDEPIAQQLIPTFSNKIPLSKYIMPASISKHILAAALKHNEPLPMLIAGNGVTFESISLLSEYAKEQDLFHESSYLQFDPDRFAAFLMQQFHNN